MKKGKSAKGRSAKDKGQQVKVRNLTNEEKYDVVTSEIEVLTKDVEEVKRQKEKELSDLRWAPFLPNPAQPREIQNIESQMRAFGCRAASGVR